MVDRYFNLDNQPEAGPSRQRRIGQDQHNHQYNSSSIIQEDLELMNAEEVINEDLDDFDQNSSLQDNTDVDRPGRPPDTQNLYIKRQSPTSLTTAASTTTTNLTTSTPFFVGPSITTTTPTFSLPSGAISNSTTFSTSNFSSTSSSLQTISTSSTRTFTSLYSTTTRSSVSASASPTYVSGVTFNLTLSGNTDDEAVYAVPVTFGHQPSRKRRRKADGSGYGKDDEEEEEEEEREMKRDSYGRGIGVGRRAPGGSGFQTLNLQVDLGSSDMWVATTDCTSSDCKSAPALFDGTNSIDSGLSQNMTYQSGFVDGEIMWDTLQLNKFSIAYQAYIAVDTVINEDLAGGNFSGILGLALPANSVISQQIPGTTSNNPDGATFLDNLFASGSTAPSQRLFSLSLERREDVRTISFLTIGSTYDRFCSPPCSPNYIPIVAQPNLGAIGYLHWRIPLMGVQAITNWDNQQSGTGSTSKNITLGPSIVVGNRNQPLAVLDSGGVAILVGYKTYADNFYAAYGVSASSDGYYRMPCKTQLAFSFQFGDTWFPVHPLDMSWPDPTDPSQQTCIGAIQYSSKLGESGDLIMGSSFLKNAYTIYSYPDQSITRYTWQPGVALKPLTNASAASQDFYAVRYLRQSLSSVSSQNPSAVTNSTPSATSTTGSTASMGGFVNTTAIVAGSIVGFFVLAALAFCGWWFFLRRKYGSSGIPILPAALRRNGDDDDGNNDGRREKDGRPGLTTMRSKKHLEALRQKSMIEGYSDYEGDSWTEGNDSMRMGWVPTMNRDDWDNNLSGIQLQRGRSGLDSPGRSSGWSTRRRSSPDKIPSIKEDNELVDTRDGEEGEEDGQGGEGGEGERREGGALGMIGLATAGASGVGETVADNRASGSSNKSAKPRALENSGRDSVSASRDSSIPRSVSFADSTNNQYPDLPSPTSLNPAAPLISASTYITQSPTTTTFSPSAAGPPLVPTGTIRPVPQQSNNNRSGSTGPRSGSSGPPRSMSMSMSGPFPSTHARGSGPELSPMYDIRSSDYFDVGSESPRGRRMGNELGQESGNRLSSPHAR